MIDYIVQLRFNKSLMKTAFNINYKVERLIKELVTLVCTTLVVVLIIILILKHYILSFFCSLIILKLQSISGICIYFA